MQEQRKAKYLYEHGRSEVGYFGYFSLNEPGAAKYSVCSLSNDGAGLVMFKFANRIDLAGVTLKSEFDGTNESPRFFCEVAFSEVDMRTV